MKRLTLIITALVLVMGMAQCKKNDNTAASDEGKGVFVSLTAGLDDGAKTEILPSGLVNWSTGDKLYVVGATDGYLGSLTTETDGSPTATFEGYINDITATQDIHFYYVGKKTFPETENTYTYSIATQDGTLGGIADNLHLTHGVLNDVAAIVTELGDINMHNMMSIAKFDISGYDSPATCNAIASRTLDLKSGTWTAEGTTGNIILGNPTAAYYMALIPSATSQTFTFKQNGSDTHPIAKSRLIEAGRMYTNGGKAIVVKEADWLPGLFSVSADKQVRFSKGNLYCTDNGESTSPRYTFAFETNQYDCRTRANYSSYLNGVMSANSPANTSGSFQWDLTTLTSDFGAFTNNLPTISPGDFLDFGAAMGPDSDWHTLSYEDWSYLLNSRGDGLYKKDVTILEMKGMVFAPDNYKGTIESEYSLETWKAAEAAGLVFLPYSGWVHYDGQTAAFNDGGYYWMSDAMTNYELSNQARMVCASTSQPVAMSCQNGRYEHPVRLVHDVPNADGTISIDDPDSDGL